MCYGITHTYMFCINIHYDRRKWVRRYTDQKGCENYTKHIRETSYHSIKLHLKQVFGSAYRQELGTKLSQKPWKQELAKIPDWPRIKTVAEFRLWVGQDCLGTHLHRIGIRPDPYCMLCSPPRNHGQKPSWTMYRII